VQIVSDPLRWPGALAALAAAAALAACAPAVDGPAERQRALDREDGARLGAQISALPGVVRAEAVVRRPMPDPLAPAAAPRLPATTAPAATAPAASIAIIVDDRADRAAIAEAARTLARAIAPGAAPAVVVEVGAIRPRLARVGPFTVEAASQAPLRAALAAALALIAALAGWIAWTAARRQRRGKSAQ
jgi:hypothetical protein